MAKKGTLEELCPPVTAIINSHTGEKTPIDLTPIWMIQAQEEVDREAREIAKWEEEEKREVALRKKNSIPALLTNGDGLLCCPQCGHHECMSMLQCSMDKYEITIEFRCYVWQGLRCGHPLE